MTRCVRRLGPGLGLAAAFLTATPAWAGDLFGGVYAHGVNTPLTKNISEGGQDFELGYRFGSILSLGPLGALRPYASVSANDHGDTSLAAGGLSLRFGGPIYARPGIGIAVHTGPSFRVGADGYRTDLGSRVLFEPELALGMAVAPRLSIEASWVHVSHAQLFSRQNPGLDMIGARLNFHLF